MTEDCLDIIRVKKIREQDSVEKVYLKNKFGKICP